MSDLRQRLARLERRRGERECPTCATLKHKPIFLRDDGSAYPDSRPELCPECGRRFGGPAKVYIGVDPVGV